VKHVYRHSGHDPFAEDLRDTVKSLLFSIDDLSECTTFPCQEKKNFSSLKTGYSTSSRNGWSSQTRKERKHIWKRG